MAAGAWVATNQLRTKLLDGSFDLDAAATYTCVLYLSTSNLTVASTASATNEHANANGYITGGVGVAFTLTGTTSVTAHFTTNPVWTASGGDITAKWAAVKKITGGDILAFCLLDSGGANVTATSGNTLTISTSTGAPVFTLA